jgi:hypothetical protein
VGSASKVSRHSEGSSTDTEDSGDDCAEPAGSNRETLEESDCIKESEKKSKSEQPNGDTSRPRGHLKNAEIGEASKSFDELLTDELEDLRDHKKVGQFKSPKTVELYWRTYVMICKPLMKLDC